MKRAGLQKQIAFIFDGDDSAPTVNSPTVTQASPAETTGIAATSPVSQEICNPIAPVQSLKRPRPVVRHSSLEQNQLTVRMALGLMKNHLFGSSERVNTKQKKTAVMACILGAVFVGVLWFSLNTGPTQSLAAESTDQVNGPSITDPSIEKWVSPAVLPENLRDPMRFAPKQTDDGTPIEGGLIVRGIVYSPKRPSAIISGQVLFEGQSMASIQIVKINRDSVEFEKDGKRWKQLVEQ